MSVGGSIVLGQSLVPPALHTTLESPFNESATRPSVYMHTCDHAYVYLGMTVYSFVFAMLACTGLGAVDSTHSFASTGHFFLNFCFLLKFPFRRPRILVSFRLTVCF